MTKELSDQLTEINNEAAALLDEQNKRGVEACTKDKKFIKRAKANNDRLQELLKTPEVIQAKQDFDLRSTKKE